MINQFEFDFDDDDNGEFPDHVPFGEVRRHFEENVDEGIRCPLCRQFAKNYRRKLNKTMVKALRLLRNNGGATEYVHAPTVLSAYAAPSREIGKLALFDLVEELAVRREDGGRAGYWKVTPSGEAFLRGELAVKKYAVVYDGRLLGYRGDDVTINEVAPEFRLDDLMDDQ